MKKNVGNVYNVMNKRNASIIGTEKVTIGLNIKSYLAVRNSFGLINDLRSKTSGKAFTQCNFDHWDVIDEDPLDENENNKVRKLIVDLRKKKNLNEIDIPPIDRFLDTL